MEKSIPIESVPDDYVPVAFRCPKRNDNYISGHMEVSRADKDLPWPGLIVLWKGKTFAEHIMDL